MSGLVQFPENVMEQLAELAHVKPIKFLVPYFGIRHYPGACDNCGGSGLVYVDWIQTGPRQTVEGGPFPWEFWDGAWYSYQRKAYACPQCQAGAAVRDMWGDTGLLEAERGYDVAFIAKMTGKTQAAKAAEKVMAMKRRPVGWLTLFGPPGVGKSGVLKALTAHFARLGLRAHYTRAEDILARIRQTYGDDTTVSEEQIKDLYKRYHFLAIDEVDRTSSTEWARATLMMVLDERHRRREEVFTALATNKAPKDLPGDFEYLASRIQQGFLAPMAGADLRRSDGKN